MSQGRDERYNTHADRSVEIDDVPPEEDISTAQADDQLDQDPEAVPNRIAAPDIDEHRRDS